MPAKKAAKRPDELVGEQVKRARESLGWKQSDLAARLEELGYTGWRQSKVAKIEQGIGNGGVKRLALDDVIALALALGVQFPHLLAPDGAEAVQVAPKLTCSRADFDRWIRGQWPLVAADERTFYLGALVPDSDAKRILTTASEAGTLVLTPGLIERTMEAGDAS
jgi:transcriptional regulator with XRE-family HTH domain